MPVQITMGKQFHAYLVMGPPDDEMNSDLFVVTDDHTVIESLWREYCSTEWGLEVEHPNLIRQLPWVKVSGPERCVDWGESPTVEGHG